MLLLPTRLYKSIFKFLSSFSPQGVLKYTILIICVDWHLEMSRLIHLIYDRNIESPSCKRIIDKHVDYCWRTFRVVRSLYSTACLIIIVPGLLCRIFTTDIRIHPLESFLPYFDPTTSPGFEFNFILHLFLIYLAWAGFCFTDTYFISLLIIARGHLKMMIQMLHELNGVLLAPEQQPPDHADHERRLKRICQEHQFHLQ